MGVSTVAKMTQTTCLALWEELHDAVMPEPNEDMWEEVPCEFCEKTPFPWGSPGWKTRQCENATQKYFSIVFLGLVDAHLQFISIDVGAYSSQGDAQIFIESAMGRRLYEGRF